MFLSLIVDAICAVSEVLANITARFESQSHPSLRRRAYRELASAYHGQVESRGQNLTPLVSFRRRGALVRVGLAPDTPGQPQPPRTRVVARFPWSVPFRLELAPRSRVLQAQPPKGTRPIEPGDPRLAHALRIHANDPEIALDFLNPTAAAALARLEILAPIGGLLISVNPERLLVQVDRDLTVAADLLHGIVAAAIVLYDQLVDAVARHASQGVAIVDEATAEQHASETIVCKVCGQSLGAGPTVRCDSCHTPHHQDCWDYVGKCSIYGCSGKSGHIELTHSQNEV